MSDREPEEFIQYWRRMRERTLRAATRLPPDRLEWTYREGKFTCGDILRHLGAIERYMFVENAALRPSRYPGHGRELAEGYAEVLAFLARVHAESLVILGGLSAADFERRCTTPGGAELPVWKWLRSMAEHEAHHRGQLYVYLGQLGVETPPLYGLTSEQVRAASAR
jgi:uncharacterized damage-inducible protein DinB